MAEYIDREKLLSDIEKYHLSDGKFQHWVEIQPAADVEHVIRCKDCKYSRSRNELEAKFLSEGVLVCTNSDATDAGWNPVFPEHFCSYGENKEIESDEVKSDV